MSNLTQEGKIIVINDVEQITEKFQKRSFVIETDEQYNNEVMFELSQERCDLIDAYKVGDNITVHFNLNGRAWTSPKGEVKYFVSLNAWRIESESAQPASNPNQELPDDSAADELPF